MTARARTKPTPSRSVRRRPVDFLRRRVLESVATLEALRDELKANPKEPKALHEYRKQARRVAAGYQLIELSLKPTEYANIQALTSVLAKGLGRWRDADVLDKRLRELAQRKSKTVQEQLTKLRTKIAAGGRNRSVARACKRSSRARLREPLEEILGHARTQRGDPLALPRNRLRLRAQSALRETATTQQLHAFRLEMKSYRYALETLAPAPKSTEDSTARQAHVVTSILGRLVDAEVLETTAAKTGPLAARVILAAARRDAAKARHEFERGWSAKRWPELQAVVGENLEVP
jgi:CHAD domain-containing protein